MQVGGHPSGVAPLFFGPVSSAYPVFMPAQPKPTQLDPAQPAPAQPKVLKPLSKAPAFTLLDQRSDKIKLSEFLGRKVLIFFYPKASTPGCTTQACGLRDIADEIGDTAVIGISPDLPAKLQRFDEQQSLGFTLLSDPEHLVAEKYGVWAEKKLYGKVYMGVVRSAFLIGETGKLEQVWYKISPKDTPKKLLEALAQA